VNPEKKEKLKQNQEIVTRASFVKCLIETIPKEYSDRNGLQETPLRVAAMYEELFKGYAEDAEQILKDAMFIDAGKKNLVLVKDITFFSTCEHHMMPFFGTVSIAYIPQDGKIVGLSKLARVVEVFARRLQVQERLGEQILDAIKSVMNPFGVAVIIKARHTCMEARGVNKPGTETITSALDGVFFLDEKARTELMQLLTM
jgi:GTP cyclohydrolase I